MKVLAIVLSMLAVCYAITGESHVVSLSDLHAGSTSECRLPNSTYCGVDYSVPDSIATLVFAIEEEIRGHVQSDLMPGQELDDCQRARKEILCAQRFPKCVDDSVILTSTPNCENKIRDGCSSSNADYFLSQHFCGLEDAVVPMGACSSLGTFDPDSALNHCSVIGQDTHITEWMYRLIHFTDTQLTQILSSDLALHMSGPSCSVDYAHYFCQFLGECSEDGGKIKVKNDYHFCESTLSCYDNNIADLLRPIFPCDRWLDLNYPIQQTTNAPTTAVEIETTTNRFPVNPSIDPSDRTLPQFNGAVRYTSSMVTFVLSLIVLAVCML